MKNCCVYFQWPYRTKRDLYLTLFSVIYLVLTTYVACIAVSYADRKNINSKLSNDKKLILDDVLLDGFHELRNGTFLEPVESRVINNLFPYTTLADTLVKISVVFILFRIITLGKYCCTFLRRTFVIVGTLYLIRAPFLVVTILPTPWLTCVSQPAHSIWADAFLLLSQLRTACGDVFWSGHSIIFTTCLFVWNSSTSRLFLDPVNNIDEESGIELDDLEKHSTTKTSSSSGCASNQSTFLIKSRSCVSWILRAAALVIFITGCLALIYGTLHYTIDVLIGIFFTSITWIAYNTTLTIPQLREKTKFGKLVSFLETV